jgi:uncharacterized membrane protein YeaQ/YmgE (transglycosylase-associated protein family)
MSVIILIIVGIAAGYIASRVLDFDIGLPQTIAIGILGALLGGFVIQALISFMGMLSGFVGAVLGAIAILWLYKTYIHKS